MKTCKACKWWTRLTAWLERIRAENDRVTRRYDMDFVEGRIRRIGEKFGVCSCPKWVWCGDKTMLEADCVNYWDIRNRCACFETGEDFGCVH